MPVHAWPRILRAAYNHRRKVVTHNFDDHSAEATVRPFHELRELARTGDWDAIDAILAQIPADKAKFETLITQVTVAWAAGGGLRSTDVNQRRLAASILRKAIPERDFGKFPSDALQQFDHVLMNDPDMMVRLRLAEALSLRKVRTENVERVLNEAAKDTTSDDSPREGPE